MTQRILTTTLVATLAAAVPSAPAAIDCGAGGTGSDVTSNGTTITINGGQINLAGATLFVNFFEQDSSTNDWIDVDGNGVLGFNPSDPNFLFVDQLAPELSPSGGGALNTWWAFNYRSVGSVNGFTEFVQYQLCGAIPQDPPSEAGIFNKYRYAANGVANYPGANPSGTPLEQCSIDGAFLDVPGSWAVQTPGLPAWNANPAAPGYGLNVVPASTGNVPQLAALTADCTTAGLNFNTDNPDADTLYSITAAWVPVAVIANRGTGIEGIKYSEAQYLFTTGRLPNGENVVGATRDAGSGTRNAAMNSLNIDPSWGRGENLGDKIDTSNSDLLGPLHQPSNKGGSSRMEGAVQNNRLAIGYTGIAGSSRAARDAARGFYEVLDVCKDVDQHGDPLCDCDAGGYVRPTIDAILDNCDACSGYQISGSGSFVVRGNIDANRDPSDPNFSTNGLPLESQATADYLNNILDSIAIYTSDPLGGACGTSLMCTTSGLDCTVDAQCNAGESCDTPRDCSANADCNVGDYCGLVVNSPAQGLVSEFFLPAAVDCAQDLFFPLDYTPNPELNQTLQDYTRANNGFGWGGETPAYGTANVAGLVPIRYAQAGGAVYADGQVTSYVYHSGSGFVTVAGGSDLSVRNRIQGDFNDDGVRDLADAAELVKAYIVPRTWQQTGVAMGSGAGTDLGDMTTDNAIPELLGDFDGDGNLTKEDLRYFADGLAITAGKLDRKAGAVAIDTALQAEGFAFPWADTNGMIKVAVAAIGDNPTFAAPADIANYLGDTGNTYKLGDFRGDVAGTNPVPGAPPRGWDGKIDATDIDYVCANIKDWSNIDEAVFMDVSCDMDGDLDVDGDDVIELVVGILGTVIGDVNLDGVKDATDAAVADATIAAGAAGCNGDGSCGWSDGDMDCDGDVDGDDRALLGCMSADFDCNGIIDLDDHAALVDCLSGPHQGDRFVAPTTTCQAIFDLAPADGDVDLDDYAMFQTLFSGQ